ncbi:hypothetical protein NCCP2495_23270 [Dietzia sp. NCCP-2495]|uniref:DUF305 domain-containing protein n=1 Tax=Dietzia sp. NCCP-2495 TaxID=2934675 RepID=UPI00222F8518|nr:DUF305 domain-containing protein [Dietzia sp. NCCP-2495]GLB64448.1 hypothetical protein NCCP2495_23270 [Dietzia sp. NCCP-2495]
MHQKSLAMTAAAAAVLLGLSACSGTGTESETTGTTATTTSAAESAAEHSEAEHSEADVMFAQMMMPHHEQAIEMSDIILAKDGVPAEVTTLAEKIKAAQGPEIAQLTEWLEQWGEPVMPADEHGGHGGHDMSEMEGMLSEEELQELSDAPGPEAATLFLEQMIAHHEGAVAMAEDEVANGSYQPAIDMAQTIIETQQAEIDEMKKLLDGQ